MLSLRWLLQKLWAQSVKSHVYVACRGQSGKVSERLHGMSTVAASSVAETRVEGWSLPQAFATA